MANTTTRTRYDITMEIVDRLSCVSTDHCPYCVGEHSSVTCNVWVTLDGFLPEDDQLVLECCQPCLIKVIDTMPYLDETMPITVEVITSVTNRPF